MDVHEREAGDLKKLDQLAASTRDAKQAARYRMVVLALKGWETKDIAEAVGSNRRTVQDWVYRYRDLGFDGLIPGKAPGHRSLLPPEMYQAFYDRMVAGPREGDGVCTLRARDAQRILREEFKSEYKLKSVYDLLHRLRLSCLKPRPRHEKSDPEKMREFKEESAPLLSAR